MEMCDFNSIFLQEKNARMSCRYKKKCVPLQPQSREKATKEKLNGALVQLVRIHACHACFFIFVYLCNLAICKMAQVGGGAVGCGLTGKY